MRKIKVWLLNKILKGLFNAVTENDILRYSNGKMYLGKNLLTDADRISITSGADNLKQMYVWQLLNTELKYLANKQMFEKSNSIDDIIFGKAMLYNLDLLEKKIDNLSKLK